MVKESEKKKRKKGRKNDCKVSCREDIECSNLISVEGRSFPHPNKYLALLVALNATTKDMGELAVSVLKNVLPSIFA